jgi:hypothetical protein
MPSQATWKTLRTASCPSAVWRRRLKKRARFARTDEPFLTTRTAHRSSASSPPVPDPLGSNPEIPSGVERCIGPSLRVLSPSLPLCLLHCRSHSVSLTVSLPMSRSQCLPHRLSPSVSLTVPHSPSLSQCRAPSVSLTVSLPVSLSQCLPHRLSPNVALPVSPPPSLSQCVSHSASLAVSLPMSRSQCLPHRLSHSASLAVSLSQRVSACRCCVRRCRFCRTRRPGAPSCGRSR